MRVSSSPLALALRSSRRTGRSFRRSSLMTDRPEFANTKNQNEVNCKVPAATGRYALIRVISRNHAWPSPTTDPGGGGGQKGSCRSIGGPRFCTICCQIGRRSLGMHSQHILCRSIPPTALPSPDTSRIRSPAPAQRRPSGPVSTRSRRPAQPARGCRFDHDADDGVHP